MTKRQWPFCEAFPVPQLSAVKHQVTHVDWHLTQWVVQFQPQGISKGPVSFQLFFIEEASDSYTARVVHDCITFSPAKPVTLHDEMPKLPADVWYQTSCVPQLDKFEKQLVHLWFCVEFFITTRPCLRVLNGSPLRGKHSSRYLHHLPHNAELGDELIQGASG